MYKPTLLLRVGFVSQINFAHTKWSHLFLSLAFDRESEGAHGRSLEGDPHEMVYPAKHKPRVFSTVWLNIVDMIMVHASSDIQQYDEGIEGKKKAVTTAMRKYRWDR